MRTKEKVYLGHPNLKRLLSSIPFRNFLSDKYQTNIALDWYSALSESLYKALRADTPPDKIKGAFQQSKRCNIEVAKQIIAIAEFYKDSEESKKVNWKNYNIVFNEETDTFKKYFRQYKIELPKEPIPSSQLDGLWTVYTSRDSCIFRSFLEIDFEKELHIFRLFGKKGSLTYCEIQSNATNKSISIKGDLEGTHWHYELHGCFDQLKNSNIDLIRGVVTIKNRTQLKMSPILLWKANNEKITLQSLRVSHWGRVTDFQSNGKINDIYEKSLLIYYQFLTENSTKVFLHEPTKNLRTWIKSYLKTKGRTRFDQYQKLLESKKWVSLSRQSNHPDKIRIYYWSFEFHPLKQCITANRIMREGEYTETVYVGEMKYHNDRFWVEFDAGEHQKKIMFLRSTENSYRDNLYFLAMGSASFISFSNDPGDMLTEIVLPMDHLPSRYHRRYNLSYNEFKNLKKIPLDLRLYLNHRDNAILSFDNPNSIKSSLQKQMAATAYTGIYHVYVYHRFLNEPYRLSRFTLKIDKLAVAFLNKADVEESKAVHHYHGLAEESNKNLQIALKHVTGSHPPYKEQFSLEARIIIDSSRGHKKREMMTGIISDADKDSKPMGMPCVLVRIDNYEKDFIGHEDQFKSILKTVDLGKVPKPLAYCLPESEEYALLEKLLWTRKRNFLESRFAKYMTSQKPGQINFLKTYFEIIGGVFYSDYTLENKRIAKFLKENSESL